ncbi:hypothetical protein GW918_02895 [Candidatus Berkelbacteria bacterium]|nr:hypothetical protein [Candidatus Berkelbacteria bacterium]
MKKINIPKFKNHKVERDFWEKIDLSKFYQPKDFVPVSFPNLKPTSRPISIRIPSMILMRVKERANELNVPYQSLIKAYIAQGIASKK